MQTFEQMKGVLTMFGFHRRYYQSAVTMAITFSRREAVFWSHRGEPVDVLDAVTGICLRRLEAAR